MIRRFLLFLCVIIISCSCERETYNEPIGEDDNPIIPIEEEIVMDHEGNKYPTKKIGKRTWMTKNMSCNTLKDGTQILSSSISYSSFHAPVCYHTSYGNLYNLLAAEQICPDGWHLPSRQEWSELFSSSESYTAKSFASRFGWNDSDIEHTPGYEPYLNNTSGFNAIPSGYAMNAIYSQNKGAYFWANGACPNGHDGTIKYIYYNEIYAKSRDINLDVGASVRCVKD